MNKKETWKDVVGYENLYKISSLGKVKSIARNTTSGELIKISSYSSGYLYATLLKNGIAKHYKIHRLVAEAFISNSENKPYVNHINCVKSDNNVTNLEWCTPRENNTHYVKTIKKSSKYVGVSYSKITKKMESSYLL